MPDFRRTLDLCAMQRLMQALGAYGFLGLVKERPAFLEHIPGRAGLAARGAGSAPGAGGHAGAGGATFLIASAAELPQNSPLFMIPRFTTVTIENVAPLVDGGRYPLKRAAGR